MTSMRMTEFWRRMEAVFGKAYAHSWANDQVLASLSGRTVAQALAQGESAKSVWAAVVVEADVPAALR
jgi:uncharacterized membrane protein